MLPAVDASALLEELDSYDPDHDCSKPLRFVDIRRLLPFYDGPESGLRAVNISNFAELAYCPYKIWHIIRGTPTIRPPRIARVIQRGTGLHIEREDRLMELVKKAKPATRRQLRDPSVDLVELPEFPGRFRRDTWLYRARLDGLARESGQLVIREFKTGRYSRKPDHLLQISAYCLASPGSMTKATGGDFRANGLTWEVEYLNLGETWGPYQFRLVQAELIAKAMAFFESTGSSSITEENLELGWRSFPAKCAPCGFAHACRWKVKSRAIAGSSTATLIPLERYLTSEVPRPRTDGGARSRRHRDNRLRSAR